MCIPDMTPLDRRIDFDDLTNTKSLFFRFPFEILFLRRSQFISHDFGGFCSGFLGHWTDLASLGHSNQRSVGPLLRNVLRLSNAFGIISGSRSLEFFASVGRSFVSVPKGSSTPGQEERSVAKEGKKRRKKAAFESQHCCLLWSE